MKQEQKQESTWPVQFIANGEYQAFANLTEKQIQLITRIIEQLDDNARTIGRKEHQYGTI